MVALGQTLVMGSPNILEWKGHLLGNTSLLVKNKNYTLISRAKRTETVERRFDTEFRNS